MFRLTALLLCTVLLAAASGCGRRGDVVPPDASTDSYPRVYPPS